MAHGPETHVFELTGGELCLDFANTVDNRTDDERRRDNLGTYRDLIRWAEQTRIVSHADAVSLVQNASRHPQAANRVLSRARQLREAIYAVFSAQAAGRRPPQAPIALIGREAAAAAARRTLVSHDRGAFSWTWQSADELDRPLWPVALSAADVLTSGRLQLVRECALETCGWLFLDTSRNQTRRWCDMRVCGNRAKARRFYERARSEQED
jgi:predicted RNA-binding Zn ribbon-like protein